MLVFAVLLFVPIFVQHVATKRNNDSYYEKKNQMALMLFFFFLVTLLAFRDKTVGNDTMNYIRYFNKYLNLEWSELRRYDIEFGYAMFNKMISLFSREPQFFLCISSIVICTLIFPTYRRLCVDSSLTVTLFCILPTFVMMFSGIKQMIAIGIGFVAYEFTRNKRLIPFALAVIIASTFHASAIVLAIMYPIYNVRITKKWLYVVVPSILAIFIFNRPIFSFLSSILEQYTEYDTTITETGAYTMLILFVLFAVFSFIVPNEEVMDDETIGLRNFLLLSVILQIFAPLHTLSMRINYYFIMFIPLLLPKIIAYSKVKWQQIAIVARYVMIVFFSIYFFISITSDSNLSVYPYRFLR